MNLEAKRARRSRRKHPKRFILIRLKRNAKVTGIEFNLREEDIPTFPEYCPVFPWLKLIYAVGRGRQPGSISIDRIDNSKGYVPGNIRIVSWAANEAKSNLTDRELVALGLDAQQRIILTS